MSTSKLGNKSAYPVVGRCSECDGKAFTDEGYCRHCDGIGHLHEGGLTKRERACIDLRIPESGNAELDVLIAKAQRRDTAAMAMQGYNANASESQMPSSRTAELSIQDADALLAELAKAKGETNAST